MPTTDPRVDAYIEKSKDFAKPILNHIRDLVHEACPDVEETWKWSFPHFTYKGDMLCHMASFKEHCAFGFWKQSLIEGADFPEKNAMGSFGKIRSLDDLPDDRSLKALITEAMRLNDLGIKVKKAPPAEKKELVVPDILNEALARHDKAAETFKIFRIPAKRNTSSGSPRPRPSPREKSALQRRSNGCLKVNGEIGNTRSVSFEYQLYLAYNGESAR